MLRSYVNRISFLYSEDHGKGESKSCKCHCVCWYNDLNWVTNSRDSQKTPPKQCEEIGKADRWKQNYSFREFQGRSSAYWIFEDLGAFPGVSELKVAECYESGRKNNHNVSCDE